MTRKMTKYLQIRRKANHPTGNIQEVYDRMQNIESGFRVQQKLLESALAQEDVNSMKSILHKMAGLAQNADVLLEQVEA